MAARVTDEEVQAIMDDYPDDLTPFIELATLLVDEELASTDLSTDRLKQIEKWLSAHFAATKTPLTTQESVKISVAYQRSSPGKGLYATQYGQQAVVLDTTGTLKRIAEGGAPEVEIETVWEDWQEGLYL